MEDWLSEGAGGIYFRLSLRKVGFREQIQQQVLSCMLSCAEVSTVIAEVGSELPVRQGHQGFSPSFCCPSQHLVSLGSSVEERKGGVKGPGAPMKIPPTIRTMKISPPFIGLLLDSDIVQIIILTLIKFLKDK